MFFLEGGERGLDFLGMVGVVVDNHDFVILRRVVIKSSSHSLEIIYARDDFFLRNPEKPAKPNGQKAVFAVFSARHGEEQGIRCIAQKGRGCCCGVSSRSYYGCFAKDNFRQRFDITYRRYSDP